MAETTPTPTEDIEAMRKTVQDYDMKAMTERQVEADKAKKPYNDFTAGKALAEVKKQVEDLAVLYASDMEVSQKINAVRMALNLF